MREALLMQRASGYVATAIVCATICVAERPAYGQAVWKLDSVPNLDIAASSRDGQMVIGDMAGAVRHGDGTIVVADKGSWNLRYFDDRAKQLRTSGREGDGPGEFRGLSWIGRCGSDTSFVWDLRHRRMSAIDLSGRVGRQFRLPLNPSDLTPYAFSCSSQGWLVMVGEPLLVDLPQRDKESARIPAPVVVTDLGGRVLRTLANVNTREFTMSARASAPLPRPLGLETHVAAGKQRVFVGTGDSAIVQVFNVMGGRSGSIRLSGSPRPATQKHFEMAVDEIISFEDDAEARSILRRLFIALPMPAYLPPHGELIVDSEDLLWVVRSIIGDPETTMDVFDGTGKQVARVIVPRFITVFQVGRNYVLGGYTDAAGIQHLVEYRLRRGGG